MAGEAVYERYKDALKRGHVAALRGRLDEALDAYAEASRIAPERATPHTAAGTALLRRRRFGDALAYYEAASRLAPRDEAALLGQAQALVALERRTDAAEAYDALAELRAANGKLADAVDAARRALELAEGRERRRTLERLIGRLRATRVDEPGRQALERALRTLEGPQAVPARAPAIDADVLAAAIAAADAAAERDAAAAAVEAEEAVLAVDPGLEAALAVPDEEPEAVAAPAPVEAVPALPAALDRDLPPGMDIRQLARLAEAAVDARDAALAVERLLDLAAANRLYGSQDAAIDACYQGLSLAPDDVGLHLALVQLYDEHGWGALASEKLGLLDRLVGLDEDAPAKARVDAARAARS
jgi:SWI/SNF-related matrix-associated actin-dependent regulator 1 of chromatin subfamily A